MLKEALAYLVGLGKDQVQIKEHNAIYTYGNMTRLESPVPEALKTNTLQSIVDYIKESFDRFEAEYIIHVISPTRVDLLLPLNDDENRPCLIQCTADQRENLCFGRFIDVTQFNIMMQSSFKDHLIADSINHKAVILTIVGNLGDGVVRNYGDDGVSQKTTIKAGVENLAEVKVPNPVELAPYRTFSEIEQPASKFIFRLESGRDEPRAALFEADGGEWKLKAKKFIIDYFKENLEEYHNVHILS